MSVQRALLFLCFTIIIAGCDKHIVEEANVVSVPDINESYHWPSKGSFEDYYNNPITKELVKKFFNGYTRNPSLTKMILDESIKQGVSPSLVFALVWAESDFNIQAINQNPTSIDRGLFQLNNRSFPHMVEADFFNPELNIKTGVSYLKGCLDKGGNEVVALAMYNAGASRVAQGGTPKMTLNYIDKILEYKSTLEDSFKVALIKTPSKAAYQTKAHKKVKLLLDRKNTLN
ncbi:lytic transglycosylase domain-containing protein [Spirochaeta cellobiosiphila]|uniref:lytic transglycosylase domain-containing protein n=1 Tax=Spirochaeta cellobiosiphila TaxID=504483 RepID=UPI00041EE674|nr:lytic transglycosylase domain-containing protein [Spirochaeta cellobiosiphila]